MATNAELIAAAVALAKKLDVIAAVDGLNHVQLKALVKDLRERVDAMEFDAGDNAEAEIVSNLLIEIEELATELGAEPKTDGLDVAALTELVESMRAGLVEKRKEDAQAQGFKDAETLDERARELAAEKEEAAANVELPEYYLMDGCALTTKRGILSDGDEIFAKDLGADGAALLEGFVETGHVGKG